MSEASIHSTAWTKDSVPSVNQETTSGDDVAYPPGRSAWIGWIIFAGVSLGLLGIFQIAAGLVALLNEDYFQATGTAPLFLAVDQQTWGVLQLVFGAAAILTAAGLLHGVAAARVVVFGLVLLGAISSLLAIGAYPIWSVVFITIDVLVLYAIAAHGAEMKPTA